MNNVQKRAGRIRLDAGVALQKESASYGSHPQLEKWRERIKNTRATAPETLSRQLQEILSGTDSGGGAAERFFGASPEQQAALKSNAHLDPSHEEDRRKRSAKQVSSEHALASSDGSPDAGYAPEDTSIDYGKGRPAQDQINIQDDYDAGDPSDTAPDSIDYGKIPPKPSTGSDIPGDYKKPAFQAVGGILGAGAGYGGSKLYEHLTGNASAIRDILAGTAGAGVGVAAGTGALKYANACLDGYMGKAAGPIGEAVSGWPTAALTMHGLDKVTERAGYGDESRAIIGASANGLAGLGGSLAGFVQGASDDDLSKMNKTPIKGAIPYLPSVRAGRRLKATIRRSKEHSGDNSKAISNILSEAIAGPMGNLLTMTAGGAAAGAGLGALAGSAGTGAALGGAAGYATSGLSMILAPLVALSTKRRTAREQTEMDSKSQAISNTLTPGKSTYDMFKRLGSTGEADPSIKQL